MNRRTAHVLGNESRTVDVKCKDDTDFVSMMLSSNVLKGLLDAGFVKPSPIQRQAIPLGRCGLDLVVQAKSGTGKTCVFAVIALETVLIESPLPQVLVLAPTREIAYQIHEVISSIGNQTKGLCCHVFIGGLNINDDKQKLKKCHIAIGSPGRIKQLIKTKLLDPRSLRLFVLDEADKLLEDSMQSQINWIYSTLPDQKQILALSATYPTRLADHVTKYMKSFQHVRLDIDRPILKGLGQYYTVIPINTLMPHMTFESKIQIIGKILNEVAFHQCLVFSNSQVKAQEVSDRLLEQGWPVALISAHLDQPNRLKALHKLKHYQCRILVSTDLTSRGIDADKVNMVVNMDVPHNLETYLHRIGRAGRFGTYGVAISLTNDAGEMERLAAMCKKCNLPLRTLPDPLPSDLITSLKDRESDGKNENGMSEELNDVVQRAESAHVGPINSYAPLTLSRQNSEPPTSTDARHDIYHWRGNVGPAFIGHVPDGAFPKHNLTVHTRDKGVQCQLSSPATAGDYMLPEIQKSFTDFLIDSGIQLSPINGDSVVDDFPSFYPKMVIEKPESGIEVSDKDNGHQPGDGDAPVDRACPDLAVSNFNNLQNDVPKPVTGFQKNGTFVSGKDTSFDGPCIPAAHQDEYSHEPSHDIGWQGYHDADHVLLGLPGDQSESACTSSGILTYSENILGCVQVESIVSNGLNDYLAVHVGSCGDTYGKPMAEVSLEPVTLSTGEIPVTVYTVADGGRKVNASCIAAGNPGVVNAVGIHSTASKSDAVAPIYPGSPSVLDDHNYCFVGPTSEYPESGPEAHRDQRWDAQSDPEARRDQRWDAQLPGKWQLVSPHERVDFDAKPLWRSCELADDGVVPDSNWDSSESIESSSSSCYDSDSDSDLLSDSDSESDLN